MITVFQRETGGTFSFLLDSETVVSGYIDVVDVYRAVYRFYGVVYSGHLHIAKSGVSNLMPGSYLCLPQVVDANSLIYYLGPDDLQIIEVPTYTGG